MYNEQYIQSYVNHNTLYQNSNEQNAEKKNKNKNKQEQKIYLSAEKNNQIFETKHNQI